MGMADYILKINFSSSSKPLSSYQMNSLTAICDTLLPSITNPHNHQRGGDPLSSSSSSADGRRRMDTATTIFYKTSASMAATPQYIGEVMKDKFKHPSLWIVRIALWMLSTWYGTFIMCGTRSLKNQFPYFQRFSKVSLEKREEILIGWSLSYFYLLRMLFHGIKFLTLLFYFSQVDEKNENPSWTALDYCGPDPEIINLNTETTTEEDRNHHENNQENIMFGPLYRGLLHPTTDSRHIFAQSLRKSGFPVTISGDQSSPSLSIHCDAVVVGSGSGGGVVAGVLAIAGYKVIVLEKGDYFARSTLSLLEGPTMDKMYQGSGLLPTEDLGVVVLAGSTVGGGSTINWSASIKTPEHVLKEWSNNYELELFESKLYKDAMDVVCERMGVQSCFHEEGFNNAVLRRGCVKLGYPVDNIPRNSSPHHYCGWCNFGCKDGRKKGTSETWLVDMVDSGNGLILPKCEAKKILLERKHGRSTAMGVAFEFDNGSQVKEVYMVESKVTIVAGGALGTPVLLKESGLKNPNIGKHLHLHPVAMAWGHFPDDTDNNVWLGQDKRSYEGGIMTAMSTVVADFDKIGGYEAIIQTPALHPGMFAALTPWTSGVDFRERMIKFSRTAHVFALARDEGSGEVKSMRTLRYKIDKRDQEKLKKGMEKLLRILVAAGAEEVGTQHYGGQRLKVKGASRDEVERFIKEERETGVRELARPVCSAHQMGSCRMGVNEKESVVDQRGETWEAEGLFVADSSVFPTALGVNPMVTVQAIAYCTAQSILETLNRKKQR